MKRFLSMALATAMTMSMASVAFAASADLRVPINGKNPVVNARFEWNDEDDKKFVQKESGPYEPGDTIYYALRGKESDGTSAPVYESEAVKGLKIKATWDLGKDAVSSVTLTKKKINSADFSNGITFDTTNSLEGARSGAYFIGITTKEKMKTGDIDISGKIELSKSETKNKNVSNEDKVDKVMLYVDATIHYEKNGTAGRSDWVVDKDRRTFKFDKTNDEQELEIIDSDTATFTVDTRGQGDIVLSANNNFNAAISAKYPNANLDFMTIEASDSFNRIGTLRVFTPGGDKYLYALDKDGNIKTASNARYDSADECYVMRTRTLGSFVLSDTELDVKTPNVEVPTVNPEVTAKPENKPFNPGTGAAC